MLSPGQWGGVTPSSGQTMIPPNEQQGGSSSSSSESSQTNSWFGSSMLSGIGMSGAKNSAPQANTQLVGHNCSDPSCSAGTSSPDGSPSASNNRNLLSASDTVEANGGATMERTDQIQPIAEQQQAAAYDAFFKHIPAPKGETVQQQSWNIFLSDRYRGLTFGPMQMAPPDSMQWLLDPTRVMEGCFFRAAFSGVAGYGLGVNDFTEITFRNTRN